MRDFCIHVLETQEIIWHLGRSRHLRGSVQTKDKQVHDQAVVLDNEGGELQTSNDT